MAKLVERRKDVMKNGIYKAAVELLTREGLDSMTMDRVAEEAGVAKGSLYNYFRNKTDLLEFVYEKTVEPIEHRVVEIMSTDAPARDKLRDMFRSVFEYLDMRRGLFNFLFNEQALHKLIAKPHSVGRRSLIQLVQQGIEEGDFRPIEPEFHATLIFGAVREFSDERLAQKEPWPVDKMVETTLAFCLHGLTGDTQRGSSG